MLSTQIQVIHHIFSYPLNLYHLSEFLSPVYQIIMDASQWERYEHEIKELFSVLPLEKVMSEMEAKHGFKKR